MPDILNIDDRFMRFSIATETIVKNVQKYKNEQLAPFGLKSMHLMFLYCLGKTDSGLTATELAKHCSVDKAFISRMATELRTMGYIDYADHADGHYKKRLLLTDHGRNVMLEINRRVSKAVEEVSAGLSREQLETFYMVLERFNCNIGALMSDDGALSQA